MSAPEAPGAGSDAPRRALHLFALCGFAVAAPLFDLLARQPQFLIAHGAGGAEVAGLVAVVILGLPLALLAVEALVAAVSRRAGAALHRGLVGLLVAVACLPPLVRGLPAAPGGLLVGAAAAAGIAGAAAYQRFAPVRLFATLLAVAPLVVAGLFWIDPSITKVRRDGEAALLASPPLPATAPLVLLVFDELPLLSLLGPDGGIDAGRYPHFAELAATATWYRDTAAVAEYTDMAVPALLTGRYPDAWRLPIAADHPVNLFSLFERSHALHVVETRTFLARRRDDRTALAPVEHGGRRLARDSLIVFAHLVTPRAWKDAWPSISEDWKDFAGPAGGAVPFATDDSYTRRLADFERFRRSIAPCPGPCLYFAHILLPHAPWRFTPEGKVYQPDDVIGIGGGRRGIWSADPWWALQGYQRHLFQVAFADRLLGRIVAALRAARLYDRSLLIVTSDHGASYRPGASRRQLADHPHPEDILRVPLFVKAPHQRAGGVDDRPVASVDVLPTAMAVLGADLPVATDGVSAADPDFAGRPRRFAFARSGRRHAYGSLDLDSGLDWKLAAFGSGPDPDDLYRLGPYRDLVGRPAPPPSAGTGAAPVATLPSEPFDAAADSRGRRLAFAPARLTGRISGAGGTDEPWVALAFGGAVRAVAPTFRLGPDRLGFGVMVPDGARREDLAVYRIDGPPDAPTLAALPVRFAPEQAALVRDLSRRVEATFREDASPQ